MIRFLLCGLLFLICFGRSDGQDTSYHEHLLIADSLIFKQDIQKSKYNILKAKSKYKGKDKSIDAGIEFREKFVRNFTEVERPDSVVIYMAEQIVRDAIEQPFSNQVKVYYASYFIETLIEERNDKEYTLEILDLALQLFEAPDDFGNIRDTSTLVHMLHNKGESLSELGRYENAEVQLNKAVKIYERQEVKDSMFWAVILYNYSDAVFYSGDEIRAFKILEESEKIHYRASNPNFDYLTATYFELASYYARLGFYDNAEFYLNRSYGIFKKFTKEILAVKSSNEDEMELFYCYQFIYLFGNKSGYEFMESDQVKALKYLKKAEFYFEKVEKNEENRVVMGAVYNYMGEFYVDQHEHIRKAIGYYDKASKALGNPLNYNFSLQYQFNKAKAYLNIGEFGKCLSLINKVINEAESINDARLAYFYTMKAHVFLHQGRLTESIKLYEKVFNLIDQNETEFNLLESIDPNLFKSNTGLVDAFLIGGSGAYLKDSIEGNEMTWTVALNMMNFGMKQFNENFTETKINSYINGEYEKLLYGIFELQEKLGIYNFSTIDLLSMSENVNSKYLWEKFQESNSDIVLIDSELLAQEQKIRETITQLKKQFVASNEDSLQTSIQTALFELGKVEDKKRKLYPNYVKYDDFDFDAVAFQLSIPDNVVVYKYEQVLDKLLKFEISTDYLKLHDLGSFELIEENIADLIGSSRIPSSSVTKIDKIGESLYDMLIGESFIEGKEIVIVADDVLSNVPFDLLRKNGSFLFENNLISYAPSLSLLDFNDKKELVAAVGVFAPSYESYSLSPQQIAVRGAAYNLEGALAEAESISNLLGTELFAKEKASKSEFVLKAKQFDVLHLSMHSFLNDEDPELSSLVFSDQDDDNELYISELYGMDLNASLAVLSACNTGVGKEKTGEGVISMTRAFTYAGIPSIVSSLWSAPDQATKEVMTAFYSELKSGKSKSEALRQAKLTYIENQEVEALKHPYFWAGFVLHGNTNALEFRDSNRNKKFVLYGLSMIGIFGIGLAMYRRKVKAA